MDFVSTLNYLIFIFFFLFLFLNTFKQQLIITKKIIMSVFNRIKNINEIGLSDNLSPDQFITDNLASYGFRGMLTAFAFDPVQGLFAAGTNNGYIHVFGQKNVEHVFSLKQNLEIRFLTIIKSVYLVVIDASSTISVFSLDTKELLSTQTVSGRIMCITSDPAMDWLFIGLDSGMINVYDVDRGVNSPYYIGNLQKSVLPKSRLSPVISLQIHPRDPARILACYKECAIVFNLISQQILLTFKYDLSPGAPGGDVNPLYIQQQRSPPFLQAIWHPHGHHILTVHVEGSLVFWDATEGVLLQARTLTDTDVNLPRRSLSGMTQTNVAFKPITKVGWVSAKNPEETAIVVAGGDLLEGPSQGVTVLDFGVTPNVSVTSYAKMGNHYSEPKRQRIFPTPGHAVVVDFIPLPRLNPFYNGGCDPNAIIFRLANGEISTLSYPDGFPIASNAALPSAFSWVQPFITACTAASVPHNQWVGMLASASAVDGFFIGGAPTRRHLRKFETRNALCTGHSDGSVRLWDASYGELDDSKVLEIRTPEALHRHDKCAVDKISFAPGKAELAIGIETGETVLYKFGSGKKLGSLIDQMGKMRIDESQPIVNVQTRTSLRRDGFLPQFIINTSNGPISALLNSEIGFIAIGHRNGNLTVVDMRGPAIIYSSPLDQLSLPKGKSGHKQNVTAQQGEYPTAIEMGIYMLNGEKFSSIVLSVGTSMGNLHTFRVMPAANGAYSVDYIGVADAGNSPINNVVSFNTANGQSCGAKAEVMDMLAQGIQVSGAIITASKTDIRIFKSPKDKIASKSSSSPIATAGLSIMRNDKTTCLVTVTEACETVVYSLPTLTELSRKALPFPASPQFVGNSLVMINGDIFIRRNQLSGALVTIWGRGISYTDAFQDALFDIMKEPPVRPTISTMQWIKGSPIATIQDVDAVVGGDRRPKSKTMIAQERVAREQQHLTQRESIQQRSAPNNYGSSYLSAPMKSISNALDNLEDTANDYMTSFNKTVNDNTPSQTGLLKSAFKAKFF